VLGPQINEEIPAVEITYSVQVLEDKDTGEYDIDGTYLVESSDTARVIEELYSEIVRQFEKTFEEAQIQSYERR
jgi:hypothetical protein